MMQSCLTSKNVSHWNPLRTIATGDSNGFGATLCLATVRSHELSCDPAIYNSLVPLQHIMEGMLTSDYIETHMLRFGVGNSELHGSFCMET